MHVAMLEKIQIVSCMCVLALSHALHNIVTTNPLFTLAHNQQSIVVSISAATIFTNCGIELECTKKKELHLTMSLHNKERNKMLVSDHEYR